MFKKLSILSLITALIFALLTACGNSEETNSSSSSEPYTIQIANLGSTVLQLAKQKGWFEEEFAKVNAKVEWTTFQSGTPIVEALASKRADLGNIGEGAALTAIGGKVDIKLISLQSDGLKGISEIIVPKGSNIKQLSDLKGKQIGVGQGTSNHVFLVKALKTVGLTKTDVNLINLQVPDAQPAFESGQLDAWVAPDPFANVEINKNGAISIAAGNSLNIGSPMLFFTRGDFAKKHPEAPEIFLRIVEKATVYQKEHFDETIQINADATKKDSALLKLTINNWQDQNSAISEQTTKELQLSADTLLELGYLKEKIDVASYVDSSYLERVKP
ncbi:putative aliphatic sulfonates-binding protein precursor [compost metagenome]